MNSGESDKLSDKSRRYEAVVIFDPSLGEAQVKEQIKKVQGIIEGNSGFEVSVDNWGKKEIAYYVGRNNRGFYVSFGFRSENYSIIEELTSLLRIDETVIKFQSHKINEKPRKFKGNPKRRSSSDSERDDYYIIDSEY